MATHAGGLIAERPAGIAGAAVRTTRLVRSFGDRDVLREVDLTLGQGSSPHCWAAAAPGSPRCCGRSPGSTTVWPDPAS